MDVIAAEFEVECGKHLDRFFAAYPDDVMENRAQKALRMLRASEKTLKGKAEGWAAGIIYAIAADGHFPCGIPNVLSADFAALMQVPMEITCYRAERVKEILKF